MHPIIYHKFNHYPLLAGILLISILPISHFSVYAQSGKQLISSSQADTWVATDGLGRALPTAQEAKALRKDKFVGVFYFIWQGAHGIDRHGPTLPTEGVYPKNPADTASPYDISKLLIANPLNPEYGPDHAWHHWGEPYFGYYFPDDEWIIRKHAQMLSDAGVDVIIIDATNASIYLPQVTKIAQVYTDMRKKGLSTPSISFILNTQAGKTASRLYENFYKKGLYPDLWFYWKGKPLLLAPQQDLSGEIKNFFTLRQSWAWSNHQDGWFGDGKDKWPWVEHYPQKYGWHESPQKPEQVSVSIAQHPMSNIGRSFHNGKQPAPGQVRTAEGLHFAEQWKRALEVDPEFIFITGWNEWIAMRFTDGASKEMLGKPIKKGETYFVDLYNEEFSRDAEPMKGGFEDAYYYQMIDGIRRFKGVRPVPVAKKQNTITTDGKFTDWKAVQPVFYDDAGDTFHRKHPAWGRIKEYVNTTGRNDIIEARVASDEKYVSFYVKTAAPLSAWSSPGWMVLLISVKDRKTPAWEGFHFIVNRKALSATITTLEHCKGGWNWEQVSQINYITGKDELELRIPKENLHITDQNFVIDFKWTDNTPADGDPMHWLDKGDTAPNGRFRYRYSMQSE